MSVTSRDRHFVHSSIKDDIPFPWHRKSPDAASARWIHLAVTKQTKFHAQMSVTSRDRHFVHSSIKDDIPFPWHRKSPNAASARWIHLAVTKQTKFPRQTWSMCSSRMESVRRSALWQRTDCECTHSFFRYTKLNFWHTYLVWSQTTPCKQMLNTFLVWRQNLFAWQEEHLTLSDDQNMCCTLESRPSCSLIEGSASGWEVESSDTTFSVFPEKSDRWDKSVLSPDAWFLIWSAGKLRVDELCEGTLSTTHEVSDKVYENFKTSDFSSRHRSSVRVARCSTPTLSFHLTWFLRTILNGSDTF